MKSGKKIFGDVMQIKFAYVCVLYMHIIKIKTDNNLRIIIVKHIAFIYFLHDLIVSGNHA